VLWPSPETPLEQQEMGEGNENLIYPSLWDFKSFLHAVKSYVMGLSGFTSHLRGRCDADFYRP
jgi:hypothetical protein